MEPIEKVIIEVEVVPSCGNASIRGLGSRRLMATVSSSLQDVKTIPLRWMIWDHSGGQNSASGPWFLDINIRASVSPSLQEIKTNIQQKIWSCSGDQIPDLGNLGLDINIRASVSPSLQIKTNIQLVMCDPSGQQSPASGPWYLGGIVSRVAPPEDEEEPMEID